MITNDYKQNKEIVLNAYQEFNDFMKRIGREYSSSIDKLKDNIKNEKFTLMVIGEAKSGKSTFINAYLGREILPMDVQQCTSSIIKISHGKDFRLKAHRADYPPIEYTDEEEIKKFLRENAAIVEEYRAIPVSVINNELLLKKKNKKIHNEDIECLINHIKKDNIFNLDEAEYESKVRNYIDRHKDKWAQIITMIEITYPLGQSLQGITIIDSPGVNAEGGVGIVSEKNIENANAIIFIKSLNGQAIESTSFTNLLKSHIYNRHKDTMFLVLTGTSNLIKNDVRKLKQQATDMYGKQILSEQIVCVDSKVQLFLSQTDSKEVDELDKFFEQLDDQGKSFDIAENCWYKSKGNKEKYINLMQEKSNFEEMNGVIEKFARKSNYIGLASFLEALKNEYVITEERLKSHINLLKENIGNPQEIKHRIDKIKEEMDDIEIRSSKGRDEISEKYWAAYREGGAIIPKIVDEKRQEYSNILDKYKNMNDSSSEEQLELTFSQLESETLQFIEEIKEIRSTLGKLIIDDYNDILINLSFESEELNANLFNPHFTEQDFEEIVQDTRANSMEMTEIESGSTFSKTKEKVPVYSIDKHLSTVVKNIEQRLDEIISNCVIDLKAYSDSCLTMYLDKLRENLEQLKYEYDKLAEAIDTVEKCQKEIKLSEEYTKIIDENIYKNEKIRKGIEDYYVK